VTVIVGVAVVVIAPVIVAALVNGNGTVGVIDAVNDGPMGKEQLRRSAQSIPQSIADQANRSVIVGVDHDHGVVPVPERDHGHGGRSQSRSRPRRRSRQPPRMIAFTPKT